MTPGYVELPFDPDFAVEDRHRRVLIGIVVGALELPDVDPWSIEEFWVVTNLADDNDAIRDLIDHGYVWGRQWHNGAASIGLTDRALAWVRDAYRMPHAYDAPDVAKWIVRVLEPQFRPAKIEPTPFIPECAYSPAEARKTLAMLDRMEIRGGTSSQAVAAYRQHVKRHTLGSTQ